MLRVLQQNGFEIVGHTGDHYHLRPKDPLNGHKVTVSFRSKHIGNSVLKGIKNQIENCLEF